MLEFTGSIFFAISFLLVLGDSFYNPASSLKYFFVDSRFLYMVFVITHILFRFADKQFLTDKLIKFNNRLIFPFVSVIFVIAALVNGLDQNFLFSHFALNLENFKYLFYISGFVLVANIKADWLKTFPQKLLYLGGILFLTLMSLYNAFNPEAYKDLLKEDGLLEDIQVLFYLAGSVISFQTTYYLFKAKRVIFAIFFLLMALGLFFIAGEEISWGQRLFNIQTPQELAAINQQNELTIHNIYTFQSKIDYIYMLVGFWGAFGWLIFKRLSPELFKRYYLFFPPPIIFFYFFAVARYYFLNQFVVFSYQLFSFERVGIGDRQELPETLLAFGFLCFAIIAYKKIQKPDGLI